MRRILSSTLLIKEPAIYPGSYRDGGDDKWVCESYEELARWLYYKEVVVKLKADKASKYIKIYKDWDTIL